MMNPCNYQIYVKSGLKAGAYHAVPIGDMSIGTTLDSQFFIGCSDMWHQLLRADASADLRSASASRDMLPEHLMRVMLSHGANGLTLTVEQGFAELGQRRLLPGDSSPVPINAPIRIGATELEIRSDQSDDEVHDPSGLQAAPLPPSPQSHMNRVIAQLPRWVNGKAAMTGLTVFAVLCLSLAIILKAPPKRDAAVDSVLVEINPVANETLEMVSQPVSHPNLDSVYAASPVDVHEGLIYNDRIVAVVTSEPAFLMTESGVRYDLGAVVDGGYIISGIAADSVEFTRGLEVQSHAF